MDPIQRYESINIAGSSRAVVGNVNQEYHFHVGSKPKSDQKSQILLESLTFDRWDARQRNVATALSNTCRWFIEHEDFQRWLNAAQLQEYGGFLWLKGKPGCGKSTLMKTAIAWIAREMPDHLVLTYFFNARAPNSLEKSSLGLYRSLVYQLLTAWPGSIPAFNRLFLSKQRNGALVEDWSVTELHNFLLEVLPTSTQGPVVVFIDALDEGSEDDVRSMIAMLREIVRQPQSDLGCVRICLSSRHYPNININKSLSIVVENQTGHWHDIRRYIVAKLNRDDGSQEDNLQQMVLQRSGSIFLWVVLVVSILNKLYDQGQSVQTRMQRVEKLPEGLRNIFNELLSRDKDLSQCITIFQWLLYSLEPPGTFELYSVVCLRNDQIGNASSQDAFCPTTQMAQKHLIHCSRGLIEFTTSHPHYVQFIHETVREFLLETRIDEFQTKQTRDDNPIVAFGAEKCHAEIAEDCMRYLAAVAAAYETYHNYPFLDYAAHYWWRHLKLAGSAITDTMLNLAVKLCLNEESLTTWTQSWSWRRIFNRSSLRTNAEDIPMPRDESELDPPLHYATAIGSAEVVKALLARGEHVDRQGCRGDTALFVASATGNDTIVRILIDSGANVELKAKNFATALHVATKEGHEDIVGILVANGVDINGKTRFGFTALHIAVYHGNVNVLRILMENGAEVNATTDSGLTALDLTKNSISNEIVQILLSSGGVERIRDSNESAWVSFDELLLLRSPSD